MRLASRKEVILCVIDDAHAVDGAGAAAVVLVNGFTLCALEGECDALSKAVRETAYTKTDSKGESASAGFPLWEVLSLSYRQAIRIKTSNTIGATRT